MLTAFLLLAVATEPFFQHNPPLAANHRKPVESGNSMEQFNSDKIFWHSRRGMLELDLLLVPFAREVFQTLDYQDQLLYVDFLAEEDQDLFAWLMKRQPPAQERFNSIIDKILAHNKKAD